jgi:ferritin-like metal-binding protein YciE
MADSNPKDAINSYVTDMLALEQHIKSALEGQIQDQKEHPRVRDELDRLLSTVEFHVSALEGVTSARGGEGAAGTVKKAGSALLGWAAGAINLLRNENLAKSLRDDYTAFNHACISYLMLHTTALSLSDQEVAALALRHFRDYARVVMEVQNLIPSAVVELLKEDGLPADASVLERVGQEIDAAWRDQAGTASPSRLDVSSR